MLALGFVGFSTYLHKGLNFRFPSEIQELLKPLSVADAGEWYEAMIANICEINDSNTDIRVTCIPKPGPLVMVWGDSHAKYLTPGLMELQKENRFEVMQLSASDCPPVLNVNEYLFRIQCDQISRLAMEMIGKLKPQLLIIGSTYREPRYFWDPNYFEEKFSKTIRHIHQLSDKTNIIVIGPVPRWFPSPQSSALHDWIWTSPLSRKKFLPIKGKATRLTQFDELLEKMAKSRGFQYISAWNVICNEEGCLNRVGPTHNDFIAFDYGHFSKSGSIYFIGRIQKDILRNLLLTP